MRIGQVIGHATATLKHSTLAGWRMLLVQPLDAVGGTDGDPLLVLGRLGSTPGDRVLLTSDGRSVRQMVGADNTPVRWAVIGIINS